MDAVKLLGAMLGNRSGRATGNGQILGQVLNGVAAITREANQNNRFPPHHHSPFENIVRDSVTRHHQAGGRFPHTVNNWVQQRPPVPHGSRVPRPRHDDHHHHDHHSGLAYNRRAEILILAMVMAAQADGQLDQAEQDNILRQLAPLDTSESDFLRREFRRRHSVEDYVRDLPPGMEYEVYSVSLMSMHLDTQAEAQYLRTLAECMRISPAEVNSIHHRMGAPTIYG